MNPELIPRHIFVDDEVVRLYRPSRPFEVDGVLYRPDRIYRLDVRTMIELIDDEYDPAEMFHSDPPTEIELDRYVWHGHLPPT